MASLDLCMYVRHTLTGERRLSLRGSLPSDTSRRLAKYISAFLSRRVFRLTTSYRLARTIYSLPTVPRGVEINPFKCSLVLVVWPETY